MNEVEAAAGGLDNSGVASGFAVEQVVGSHKISDPCSWQTYAAATIQTTSLQKAFDELIRRDGVFERLVSDLCKNGLKAVVIGGWVRDHVIGGGSSIVQPRDIDLVVEDSASLTLEGVLPEPSGKTVFGGLTFRGQTLDIDLWPLRETYLLKRFGLAFTFSNVLAVTDFNINAVLFYPRQFWSSPMIEDGGCFSSMNSRELDFHFEWVPIPLIQAARLAHFSAKTGFGLSAGARAFIRSICSDGNAREQVLQNLDKFCPLAYRSGAKEIINTLGAVQRTLYFSNCLGVFEGGGVRAAAFAGAYTAASEAGITFTKVSGTSGGAIAAAFIATGAQSDEVKRQLFDADLAALAKRLDGSRTLGRGKRMIARLLRNLTWGRVRIALTVNLFAGLYTSEDLGVWIDHALHALLLSRGYKIGSRHVTFADLPIPLHVVASDLTRNRPQVWSRESTPDASVAFAVRCSCTIPFFYQPVRGEDIAAYVDGGMLSNTPAFVFRDEQGNDRSRYSARILAFRLTQHSRGRRDVFGSIDSFVSAVSDTVIDGAGYLQRGLQSGVYTVDIDTADISSTDFGKIGSKEKAFLFDQGRSAVEQFVRGERDKLYAANAPSLYVGRDQKMLLFVNALKDCERELVIVDKDSHWLYLIFPAFLAAARRGVRIRFVTTEVVAGDQHEVYRRGLLAGLGVTVFRVPAIPYRGFLSDPTLASGLVAVTHSRNLANAFDYESTRTYSMHSDPSVIQLLHSEIAPLLKEDDASRIGPKLAYSACAEAKLFDRLRSVPQYADAKFSLGEVLLDENLHGLQTHIKEFKYLQIEWLIRDFTSKGIDLFMPQEVVLAGDLRTIVTPPVVEVCGEKNILVEGHTRAFHCLRIGRPSFLAVIVDDVDAALPTRVQRFKDIAFASRTVSMQTQFEELDRGLWREIESHVHPTQDPQELGWGVTSNPSPVP